MVCLSRGRGRTSLQVNDYIILIFFFIDLIMLINEHLLTGVLHDILAGEGQLE